MSDITFYNMWRTASAEKRAALLDRMKSEAPALGSKAGFISMTVLECAEDGRVLVEGRWQSKDAFNAAVADNPEAKESRASLEEFGSPEPGLFTKVFHVSAPAQAVISASPVNVTLVQIWRMSSAEHQRCWLETMHHHIGILNVQPGFVSLSLHTSPDGKQTAVYAQWTDEAALTAATSLPEAKRAHDEMAKWGESDGALYLAGSVYLPGTPSRSPLATETRRAHEQR